MASLTAKNFTVDTKDSCFMCLKYCNPECSTPATSMYSFQRLSKYLQLDLKNVYKISFPITSVSILGDSEILVSLCDNCSTMANKFVKLHKDLELVRKRVNTCVGQINQVMLEANKNPKLLKEYRHRITVSANPLELIQASIAENLRKETIEKCSKIIPAPGETSNISRVSLPVPGLSPLPSTSTPSKNTVIVTPVSQKESSRVSSTTSIVSPCQKKDVLVVDLEDSDDEEETVKETESQLIISSVTGASGRIFSTTSSSYSSSTSFQSEILPSQSSLQQLATNAEEQCSVPNKQHPSPTFCALQNFTNDFEFDLQEFGIGNSHSQSQGPSSSSVVFDNDTWKKFSDGSSHCKLCGKIFESSNPENLAVHARIHAGVKPISCPHCNQAFRSAGNRRIHILKYHRKELFSQFRYPAVSNEIFQQAINVTFEQIKKMDQEEGENDNNKSFKCLYCTKYCRHKIDVEAHMVNHHFNEIGSKLMEIQRLGIGNNSSHNEFTEETVKRKRLSCGNCELSFRSPSILSRHLANGCAKAGATAETIPNINIDQTGAAPESSTSGSGATKNSNTHIIKWKCGTCLSTFGTQGDLKRHKTLKHGTALKLASTEPAATTTFKCQYCGKKFKFHYSQRLHMLTMHRFEMYSKFAPNSTLEAINNGINLILKQNMVSTDQSHACKFCNREYTGSVATILQNHILVNHFQEVVSRLKSAVLEVEELNRPQQVESTTDGAIKLENNIVVESVLPD